MTHKRPVIKPKSAVRGIDKYAKKSGVGDVGKVMPGHGKRGRKRSSK